MENSKVFNLLEKALKDILRLPNLLIVNPPAWKDEHLKIISFMYRLQNVQNDILNKKF
jgi:hypothetical protein